ncbi:MAG: hypothetical protein AAGD34_00750 [Pseudomonadota bacterium]
MRHRFALPALATLSLLLPSIVQATEVGLVRAPSADAFKAALCHVDRSGGQIFVVPLSVFEDGGSIDCDGSVYSMRIAEPADDPGHVVLNIDPPSDLADGFDCDAKADIGLAEVALNCLPANAEAADHRKQ